MKAYSKNSIKRKEEEKAKVDYENWLQEKEKEQKYIDSLSDEDRIKYIEAKNKKEKQMLEFFSFAASFANGPYSR